MKCLWFGMIGCLLTGMALAGPARAGEYNDVLSIGDAAPAWVNLPGVDGKKHSLADLKGKKVVVVVFTCNSCPVAQAYEDRLIAFTRKYAGRKGKVAVVAINVNTIPKDRLPKMKERAREKKYNFPYLYDASQKIGKKYGAGYTPEFIVLDKRRKVVYMGAMDDRIIAGEVKVNYLEAAVRAALKGKKPPTAETLAKGCRIRYERRKKSSPAHPGEAMSHAEPQSANPAPPDRLLQEIADYTLNTRIDSAEAWETARYCLLDALGCGLLALGYPACSKLIDPVVPGAVLPGGARVPGTRYELDPVQAAFCIGAMLRWLDFNDTWLAAEWGHPSDNLGGILAVADYLGRRGSPLTPNPSPTPGGEGLGVRGEARGALTMRSVLEALIKAYEIQGVLALNHSFNRVGFDHVLLVRIASTAVVTALLGGSRAEVINAVSNAFIDGGALRTYRHAPNTGSRKSWAAGDATSRAVRLALMARQGEMGYPSALTAPVWGFQDVLFRKQALTLAQPLGSYVMENILFKISFPAEFHAQTAVEAAFALHPQVKDHLEEIETIQIGTQESAVRIIDKTGPLHNPADRDHCLQYMVAVALIKGSLTAEDYEDQAASDPRIDRLRDRMVVTENPRMTADYLDPAKRSIGNSVQVVFRSGRATETVTVDYPLGHRRRRDEGIPLLLAKFQENLRSRLSGRAADRILEICTDQERLGQMPVQEFVTLFVV